jgi:hypothetical protein
MTKQEFEEIIALASEDEIDYIIECLKNLRNNAEITEFFLLQRNSNAYLEWISAENDIYDEVFRDEIR